MQHDDQEVSFGIMLPNHVQASTTSVNYLSIVSLNQKLERSIGRFNDFQLEDHFPESWGHDPESWDHDKEEDH